MLDIGWSELLLIGVVALIVVGPKDLPVMFRTLGRFTAKARSMAREFQRAMDDAAKSTGVHETMKDVRDLTSKKSLGLTALENAADKFEKWNPMKPEARPASPAPTLANAQPAKAEAEEAAGDAVARPEPGPATKALAEKVARQRKARQAKANGRDGGEGVALEAEPVAAEAEAAAEPAKTRRPRAKAAPAAPNGAAPAKPVRKAAKSKAASVGPAAAAAAAPAARTRKSPTKKIDA